MNIVIIGLSITSSWGNGHATTYRGLVRELEKKGHNVLFLEKDVPWYAGQRRDLPNPPYGQTVLYKDNQTLKNGFAGAVKTADLVIVGSYVQQGVEVGEWVTKTARGVKAFYDIDTPVTLAKLGRKDYEYLHPRLIPEYDLYLSFTGGPVLDELERKYYSPCARALYCSVDPGVYYPEERPLQWDLGYLGTYSDDRQPLLEKLMLRAAEQWKEGRFVVAGPQYPETIIWPDNVDRFEHLSPEKHRAFYNAQRFTQNITRADMVQAGFSPSVRLFEAAACGVPIISDFWEGLETVFEPGKEILIARTERDTLRYLKEMTEEERKKIGSNARARILKEHTAAKRADTLIAYIQMMKTVEA